MKRLLDQWERKNSKAKSESKTVDDWEREIADDEVMRDASPPPPPERPVVSDDSAELPAPLLPGQVEALETVGICMLVEYMLAPPGAEEPQQLRAFWPDASAATPVRTRRLFLVDGVFMRPHRRDTRFATASVPHRYPPKTLRCSTTSCFGYLPLACILLNAVYWRSSVWKSTSVSGARR